MRPFDEQAVGEIARAINAANLGLSAQVGKTTVRVPIPPLSQERRGELAKAARAYGEEARVALRNVRRDELADLKSLPTDERRRRTAEVENWMKIAERSAVEAVEERCRLIEGR